MLRKLHNKLRSRRGASITFALFLFLICATVGSVVLAAGTAASGRLSQTPETDQRYYAVSSAAELLRGALDGQTTTSVRTTVSNVRTGYSSTGSATGSELNVGTGFSENKPNITYTVNGKAPTANVTQFDSFIDEAVYKLMLSHISRKMQEQGAADPITDPLSSDFTSTLSVTVKEGAVALDDLTVTVEETLTPEGQLTLLLKNGSGSDVFTMKLVFKGAVTTDVSTKTTHGTPVSNGSGYTITDTTTETVTTTVNWSLASLETVFGTPPSGNSGGNAP